MDEIIGKLVKLKIKEEMDSSEGLKVPVPNAFKPGSKRDTEAATVFIRRIEMYFRFKTVPEINWAQVIAMYLDGTALKWYDFFMSDKVETPTWQEFKEAFLRTYTSRDHEKRTIIKYESLKQLGPVARYNEIFLSCLQTMGRDYTTEAGELMHYLLGLKQEIRRHVTAYNPLSLKQAMDLALDSDERAFNVWGRTTEGPHPTETFARKDPNAMEVDVLSTNSLRQQRLRQQNGVSCYRCGKPGHISRECPKNASGRY